MNSRPTASRKGQATIEFAITYGALILPITSAIVFTAQLLWVWHSVVDFTRDGARYAVTHCWQGNGQNVATYMRTHVPPMVDMDQFQGGGADIDVRFFQRNTDSGQLEDFTCAGSECSADCVPDAVTVHVRNYEFRRFLNYLGLPGIPLPDFQTSLPMESAGCDPDTAQCLP